MVRRWSPAGEWKLQALAPSRNGAECSIEAAPTLKRYFSVPGPVLTISFSPSVASGSDGRRLTLIIRISSDSLSARHQRDFGVTQVPAPRRRAGVDREFAARANFCFGRDCRRNTDWSRTNPQAEHPQSTRD